MTKTDCRSFLAALFGVAVVLGAAAPASAQYLDLTPTVVDDVATKAKQGTESATFTRPSLFKPFTDILGDFRRLPTRTNAEFLVVGLAAAAGSHRADTRADRRLQRHAKRVVSAGRDNRRHAVRAGGSLCDLCHRPLDEQTRRHEPRQRPDSRAGDGGTPDRRDQAGRTASAARRELATRFLPATRRRHLPRPPSFSSITAGNSACPRMRLRLTSPRRASRCGGTI